MELTKQNNHQCLRDLGRIWMDIMSVKYGTRYVSVNMDLDKPGEQPLGMELEPQTFTEPFDFSTLKDVQLSIEQEAGGSSYWSEMASMQTLDNLLMNKLITPEQYIERLPEGYVNKREELLAEMRAARSMEAMAQPMAPAAGGGMPSSAQMSVPTGSGNGALQRAINREGV